MQGYILVQDDTARHRIASTNAGNTWDSYVDVTQDKVRAVAEEGELEHEGSHATATLTDHMVRTNDVLTQVSELVTDWVVDGGVEA